MYYSDGIKGIPALYASKGGRYFDGKSSLANDNNRMNVDHSFHKRSFFFDSCRFSYRAHLR